MKLSPFFNISYRYHIVFALIIRLVLIVYGEFHDQFSEVPYTDVDYKVFTDASRHLLDLNSPYNRHTYRYTPLLAILLLPNILVHFCFGKVLFSIIDLFVGLLIRTLVKHSREKYSLCKDNLAKINRSHLSENNSNVNTEGIRKRKYIKTNSNRMPKDSVKKEEYDFVPNYCMLFWIYNPMSIAITTRGNCDSVAVFLVLLTLYFLQCRKSYFIAGLIHGLAVHVRLYPIFYSLSYFMFLSKFSNFAINNEVTNDKIICDKSEHQTNLGLEVSECHQNNRLMQCKRDHSPCKRTIFKMKYLHYFILNNDQVWLIIGSVLSLTTLVSYFYYLYGYKFIYETYIFHIIRKDTRHNFSLFFYLQYLTAGVKNIGIWQKVLSILPQIVLLVVLSVRYGLNRFTLHFSILTQTIVMVAYNSVLTSQYFIWILGILPLALWQLEITFFSSIVMAVIWFAAQLAWLLPAYLLEFHGQNTFIFIWLQSVSFFCGNMAVLGRLIKCFMYENVK